MTFEAERRIDFIKPHLPGRFLSNDEKQKAADAHIALTGDFIQLYVEEATHPSDVWTVSEEGGHDGTPLIHLSHWFKDNSMLAIAVGGASRVCHVGDPEKRHSHYPNLSLTMQEPGETNGWAHYEYRAYSNGDSHGDLAVRRLDTKGLAFEDGFKADFMENLQLEIDMGFNRLPVSSVEIEQLRLLIAELAQ